ncbi:uncharacterized protein LOC753902 [Strongylocentrotus purpuratus]|uniref:Uncharacterized protein n=1 Tax=Strongylocentrotus purpuratus TaxID=7668 RepID=A0A7M7PM96_STRPU|nr:uncharacterized protein LOC753902 [Strongylocentrotus purpuratus]
MGRKRKRKKNSSDRATVYFVPDNVRCRRRLWRLMGGETVDLTSARYMDALAEKVLQEYEEKLIERERELAQNEIRRERDLMIRGLIPDPDEHKKHQPRRGTWGSLRRHRVRTKKEPSSGRPPHPNENMPEGLSSYQQKIFCSSNFRDFTDDMGPVSPSAGTSSESPKSRRASRLGTKSRSSRN